MGRPPNTDAAETRRRVLGAAGRLFSESGASGTSVRDIAAAARVTGATVLHHFGSKEALYAATIDAMYEEIAAIRDDIQPALAAAGPDVGDTIEATMRAIFRSARTHQGAIRLLLRHVIDTGEIGSGRRERQLLPFLETGAALFSAQTGRPAAELRLVLQSLVFLVGRWAITSSREASAIAGVKGEKAAFAAIEDGLVDTARRLLAPKEPS